MGTSPPMGASNAHGVVKNCDSQPVSGFIACCQWFNHQVSHTHTHTAASDRRKLVTLVAGKWHHL